MQYKILALDLDGTLTNTDKIITPRTKAALQAAAQRGVCIVPVSYTHLDVYKRQALGSVSTSFFLQ